MNKRKNTLKLGKLSKDDLDELVLSFLPIDKRIELDGAIIDLEDEAVISHSPSIGVPNDALGFFAFHYSASNVAVKFGIPTYMVVGIYLPLKTPETDLKIISKTLGREAEKFGVKIVAGQTATYNGLEIPIITSTCIGRRIWKTGKPGAEDTVIVIGEIGGESLWLKSLSEGRRDHRWRQLTPLPAALELQKIEDIRLMHDISEGGLIGALCEISQHLDFRIDLDPVNLKYDKDSSSLGKDILSAPTYGTLIAITSADSLSLVEELCEKEGYPLSIIGPLKMGKGVYVNGEFVKEHSRVDIDKIYGSFKVGDEVIGDDCI